MPPKLALLACLAGIAWLFMKERKSREGVSAAVWLPVVWAFIIGSKPVSLWLNPDPTAAAVDYLEGSPLDRMVLFTLIAGGLFILFQRRENWSSIIWSNKWVFGFYLYLGLSVMWSDYSFISFKRWIKDFGNVIMALVVLSEVNPGAAIKSVLLRCTFLLVPLSVVLVKYYPDIGRYYDRWNYSVYISGVAGDKNLLGMALFVCAVFLVHLFLESRKQDDSGIKVSPRILILLLLLNFWLLLKAHSVTAFSCTVLGAITLLVLKRYGARRAVLWSLLLVVLVIFASVSFDVTGWAGSMLGRDSTLTGRTEIWSNLLQEKVNPLVGVGFYSFWMGERIDKLSEKYHYTLNEAHNGYLELYLNSGLIGLFLLIGIMVSSLRAQWSALAQKMDGAAFRVALLTGTMVYNIAEATFNRLSIIWFTFLLIVVVYPRTQEAEVEDAAEFVTAAETTGQTPI